MSLHRRDVVTSGLALATASILPARSHAQAKSLVAATFPGTWADAHRLILRPAFQKRDPSVSLTQTISLGTDQIAKLQAGKGGVPAFDVALLDAPQVIDAVAQGLISEYPAEKSSNFKSLLPPFQSKWGPTISLQVIGIGYNPNRIKTPPKSWDELWDPKYKGRVGLTALNSQLGIAFLAEINRMKGGSETNFEPAFKALRDLLPNIGAVAANLGAYATLWQQEQIDIAPYNFNFVQTLKGKDVPVEFAIPESGLVGWNTSMHIAANTAVPDLALDYIDTHLDPAVQSEMLKPPYDIIPTSSKVPLAGAVSRTVAATPEDLAKLRSFDWSLVNPQRGALIDRFNREIKL